MVMARAKESAETVQDRQVKHGWSQIRSDHIALTRTLSGTLFPLLVSFTSYLPCMTCRVCFLQVYS